ncbi:MAG TPA: YbaK/EbsC family protein [Candidatus Eisenbacteria bacterium]|jgi:Ala-tRNA(Pro) deacylase
MKHREKLEAYLRENRVPFQVQHHALAFTTQEVAERGHVHGRLMAKVVIVVAGRKNVMLVLPAPSRVDLERAEAALNAGQVRLAREDEFARAFPDCELGAMPPFGNLYGLPVVVDRALTADETIYFQAGTHTDTMSLRYADFERLVKPAVAEFGRVP